MVHISSGVSALVCALVIGRRLGFGSEPMPPHNLTYTAIGAALLWVGWFGFNAGSALAADGLAASAFAVTHFGAAAGALAWAGMEWLARGKPTLLGTCFGRGGRVGVRHSGRRIRSADAGARMGVAAGVVCYLACTALKNRFGYDDSLDAFGVHGVGGTLGRGADRRVRDAGRLRRRPRQAAGTARRRDRARRPDRRGRDHLGAGRRRHVRPAESAGPHRWDCGSRRRRKSKAWT